MNLFSAVIPAGGSSSRFGEGPKLFRMLGGEPVILRSLRAFLELMPPERIAVPVHKDLLEAMEGLLEKYLPDEADRFRLCTGGKSRTESVRNAMEVLPPEAVWTAVHDGARPLITPDLIRKTFEEAVNHGGAMVVKPVTDTIKRYDENGLLTSDGAPSRDRLRAAETPQIFRREVLSEVLGKAVSEGREFTDDAAAVEYYTGLRAFPVEHRGMNFKITLPSDLVLAEAWLKNRSGALQSAE